VRDLLLRRPVMDLDLAVEGDGIAFGRALARELRAGLRVHERFGTAVLEFPDGSRLDVASTREETYERGGALPRVVGAPLARDLARRDFTINAMAVRLAFGRSELIDPFGGHRDLVRKRIRMLHADSPQDDPTRAFRAVRYANRLGFGIERETRDWIARALDSGAFEAISGDRLRRELVLLLSETNRARAVALLARLGLLRALEPALASDSRVLSALKRAEAIAGRHPGTADWFLYLLVWAGKLDAEGAARLCRRLSLAGERGRALRRWPETLANLRAEISGITPSREPASGLSANQIAAAAALVPGVAARRLERAFVQLETRLSVGGRDLIAAGVPEGPHIGRALQATLCALRDGRISRREELAFAIRAALHEAS